MPKTPEMQKVPAKAKAPKKANQLGKLIYYSKDGTRVELTGGSLLFAAEMLMIGTEPDQRPAFIQHLTKKAIELENKRDKHKADL